jgi:hypothetical protein
MALARVLIAAGIVDQPVTVTHRGVRGEIRYRSLYRLAGRTFTESAGTPVCETRYTDPSERFAPSRGEVETCVTAASGVGLPAAADIAPESGAKTAVPQLEAATIPRVCEREGCGKTFLPRRSWSTFCSGRCRVAAHRHREAGRRLAAQRAANSSAPKSDLTRGAGTPLPVPFPPRTEPVRGRSDNTVAMLPATKPLFLYPSRRNENAEPHSLCRFPWGQVSLPCTVPCAVAAPSP